MYQFYYSKKEKKKRANYKNNIRDQFQINMIRPTMWEEHCLECSAPLCFETCPHYQARKDGRCKRFENGINLYRSPLGCNGQAVRVHFRKWANMMTIVFPTMMNEQDYLALNKRNQRLGHLLKWIVDGHLPVKFKWSLIRILAYGRRRLLRQKYATEDSVDAFLFHGYSFEKKDYNLIIEIYENDKTVFKKSIPIQYGENLTILRREELDPVCWTYGNLIKVYPENDIEAELDILWCDFVKGTFLQKEKPAEKVKCLVWDLDNTVWDGILIETDDPESLTLKAGVSEIMQIMDERGILQSAASKNTEEDVTPLFEKLGISQYMLYPQINWGPKSQSLEVIADRLNIGLDSLALIDDSVFERKEVKYHLPQVRTYDPLQLKELPELPEFDLPVTEESKKRRTLYQTERLRNQERAAQGQDTEEFLRQSEMELEYFIPVSDSEKKRCFELLQRTNQLNMSGIKYTEKEFLDMLSNSGTKCFAFSVSDKYGSYGIVGFGQYLLSGNRIIVTEYAMSCRVAGKCIENALFAFLLQKEHVEEGRMNVKITAKNKLLRKSLQEIGFTIVSQSKNVVEFKYTTLLKNRDIVKVVERSAADE